MCMAFVMPKLAVSMPFPWKHNNSTVSLRCHHLSNQVKPDRYKLYYLLLLYSAIYLYYFFIYKLLEVCFGLVQFIFFNGYDFFQATE